LFNGLAVWLVKPPTTATYKIQTLIGFINYDRLLAVVIYLLMNKLIAEIGDTISWTFDDTPTESEMFRGKTFSAKVAMVDVEERHYGVYADYGQDLIPFDHATIQRTNNR
jgi:hypothetical protein